jgi:hypothetical protein
LTVAGSISYDVRHKGLRKQPLKHNRVGRATFHGHPTDSPNPS